MAMAAVHLLHAVLLMPCQHRDTVACWAGRVLDGWAGPCLRCVAHLGHILAGQCQQHSGVLAAPAQELTGPPANRVAAHTVCDGFERGERWNLWREERSSSERGRGGGGEEKRRGGGRRRQ